MTIKQKFSSIDQSKLTADQKAFLTKIKDVTKNFTDAEMNKKVEAPLDGFIAKAKEKMPEAIKSAPAKRTGKAKTSQTRKPKRTAMSLAKEIRKEGESWKDAQARASKMMKEDSKDLSKTVETELDKLSKLVRSQKQRVKLTGLSGTNIKRDSVRRAKPKGRRISKYGNVYYENRDNRTDRLAPNYPKNAPFLAEGGYLTDPNFGNFQNQVLATGGSITNERRYVNKGEDYEVRYSKPILRRKGYQGKRDFELGGTVLMDLAGHTSGGTGGLNAGMPLDGFDNTSYSGLVGETGAMSSGEMFMNGGGLPSGAEQSYMITQSGGNPAQHYARGGGVRRVGNREYSYGRNWTNDHRHINKGEDHEVKYTRKGKFLGVFKEGGAIPNNYEGKSADDVWKDWSYDQKYHFLSDHKEKIGFEEDLYNESKRTTKQKKSSMGTDVGFMYIDIDKIINTKYTELPRYVKFALLDHVRTGQYNKGGALTNERLHVNHDEDYEVRYAKPRPSRKGYKGKRIFSRGGLLGQSAKVKFLSEEFASLDLIDELKAKLKTQKNNVEDKDVIAFAYTDYGGDILDKYAIEYFLENHPNNIVVESTSYSGKNAFVFGKPAKEWMEETQDYPLGFEDFESFYYDKENEDFEEGINFFIEDLKRDYSFDEDEVRDSLLEQFSGYFNVSTSGLDYSEDTMINYLKENDLIKEEYNKGGALTNERKHVNHDEDYEVRYAKPRPSRKGYKGTRKFMAGGMNNETPRIYVADLEAYNNGRLVGEWLDLSDYNDADELMDAIQDGLKKSGGEEYAIHDVENVPRSMYSEYMGKRDFEELYEMMDLADKNDLPLSVVSTVVSEYGSGAVDEFVGKYDSADDFAQEMVDDLGIESFIDFERYLIISETDRRLLAQEMADSYVEDIKDEDGGNRLIEEAGMDVSEYEEADSETQEEMLDKAREIVYDEYYDTWYDGLNDPYYFLVEEQGMYDAESFAKANFVQVDYEALAEALEYDYAFVYSDGDLYVFNIR
jgi:antirestriction protein